MLKRPISINLRKGIYENWIHRTTLSKSNLYQSADDGSLLRFVLIKTNLVSIWVVIYLSTLKYGLGAY